METIVYIYKLSSNQTEKIYIGSTRDTEKRLSEHKCESKTHDKGSKEQCQFSDVKLTIIDTKKIEFTCDQDFKDKKRMLEQIWMDTYSEEKLSNKYRAWVWPEVKKELKQISDAKYSEKNKEALAKKHTDYYNKNKEAISEKSKEYRKKNDIAIKIKDKKFREENADLIKARKSAPWTCDVCLRTITWDHHYNHICSTKEQQAIQAVRTRKWNEIVAEFNNIGLCEPIVVTTNPVYVSCDICKKEYNDEQCLKRHVCRGAEYAAKPKLDCPYCGKQFVRRCMQTHIKAVHPGSELLPLNVSDNRLKCECGGFYDKSNKVKHSKTQMHQTYLKEINVN